VSSTLCPLCNMEDETIQHVLFEYVVSRKVWSNCHRWIGIEFVRPNTTVHHFMNFNWFRCNNKVNTVWKGTLITIVWEIWKHRNNVVFKCGVVDATKLLSWHDLKFGLGLNLKVRKLIAHSQSGAFALVNA